MSTYLGVVVIGLFLFLEVYPLLAGVGITGIFEEFAPVITAVEDVENNACGLDVV